MTSIDNTRTATSVRRLPLSEFGTVHGVTCDDLGNVWFADGDGDLVCVEPESGRVVRHFEGIGAKAGTAFDGTHLWQIAGARILCIDPRSGEILRTLAAPEGVHCSGMAYAEGALWIGDFDGKCIVKLDVESGDIQRRLDTGRFVTGVSWSDDALWHGAWDREEPTEASLQRIDPVSGEVVEVLRLPQDLKLSGLARDKDGRFWCGGGYAGGLQAVRPD